MSTETMNNKDLDLLEKAFEAEMDAVMNRSPLQMMQTNSSRANSLVDKGRLSKARTLLKGGVMVEGYELTELGRLTYCMSSRCEDTL